MVHFVSFISCLVTRRFLWESFWKQCHFIFISKTLNTIEGERGLLNSCLNFYRSIKIKQVLHTSSHIEQTPNEMRIWNCDKRGLHREERKASRHGCLADEESTLVIIRENENQCQDSQNRYQVSHRDPIWSDSFTSPNCKQDSQISTLQICW